MCSKQAEVRTLVIDREPVEIIVSRKRMKTVRLRVLASGEIRLSVPLQATNRWIDSFLREKKEWIAEKRREAAERKGPAPPPRVGQTMQIQGRAVLLRTVESAKRQTVLEGDALTLYGPGLDDPERMEKQLDAWWRQQALSCYEEMVSRMMPLFEKHGARRPELTVRKMRTLWGSCSKSRGKVSLNTRLYHASLPCIELVVMHELTHLLYPKHDKAFYGFLGQHMPDWEARKKRLHQEVVLR